MTTPPDKQRTRGDWLDEQRRHGAYLSDDEKYRYALWRNVPGFDSLRTIRPETSTVAFVMLNPSTADHTEDDPTIRRCLGYARRWGFPRLAVVNLYAYRATRPSELAKVTDPVGPENDDWITLICGGAELVVCAWGAQPGERGDNHPSLGLPFALGLTKAGLPRHPLYMPGAIDVDDLVPFHSGVTAHA